MDTDDNPSERAVLMDVVARNSLFMYVGKNDIEIERSVQRARDGARAETLLEEGEPFSPSMFEAALQQCHANRIGLVRHSHNESMTLGSKVSSAKMGTTK